MSSPARRRKRRSTPEPELIGIIIVMVAGVAFTVGIALGHASALIWVLITAVLVVVAYGLGCLRERPQARKPAPRKPVSGFRQAKRAAAQAARNDKPITAKADSQGRRNGWLPPANTQLTTLAVSPQCAAADCVACPGGGCQCTCEHDPAVIVARNQRAYDAAHPDDAPPF